jgi:hypothetical protein
MKGNSLSIIAALVIFALALSVSTLALITETKTPSYSVPISTSASLDLYSDSACVNDLTSFDWGVITPGSNVTRSIYIKNTSTEVSLVLNMTIADWNPTTADGPISITWDQEGTRLSPGQATAAQITLTSDQSVTDITDFTVQIYINGVD